MPVEVRGRHDPVMVSIAFHARPPHDCFGLPAMQLDFRPERFAQLQQFIDGHVVEVTKASSARIMAKQ